MRKKASIAVFTPFYPPTVGGLANHATEFNDALVARGYTFHVFAPDLVTQSSMTTPKQAGVLHHYFPAIELIPNYPIPAFWSPAFWRWRKKVSQLSIDLALSRTRFFVTSLMAWEFAHQKKIPWLHVEHGSDFVQTRNIIVRWLALAYDHTLGRLVLTAADSVVALSKATAYFVEHLSQRKVTATIYRGVTFSPAPRSKHQGPVEILYLGRLIDGKGVHHLIAALEQLARETTLPPWRCSIIGTGPAKKALKAQVANAHVPLPITFKPAVPATKVAQTLATADIVVNPSLTEGLPTNVIEALLAGCRVVATDVGGTKEITQNEALILSSLPNSTQLLKSIRAALEAAPTWHSDPVFLTELRTRFSWRTSAEHYDRLITTLLTP